MVQVRISWWSDDAKLYITITTQADANWRPPALKDSPPPTTTTQAVAFPPCDASSQGDYFPDPEDPAGMAYVCVDGEWIFPF